MYREFVDVYNWERPHEALEMRVPGALYVRSFKERPAALPIHTPLGEARRVDVTGYFSYHGRRHRAGRGLAGHAVDIRPSGVHFASVLIGPIERFQV